MASSPAVSDPDTVRREEPAAKAWPTLAICKGIETRSRCHDAWVSLWAVPAAMCSPCQLETMGGNAGGNAGGNKKLLRVSRRQQWLAVHAQTVGHK